MPKTFWEENNTLVISARYPEVTENYANISVEVHILAELGDARKRNTFKNILKSTVRKFLDMAIIRIQYEVLLWMII